MKYMVIAIVGFFVLYVVASLVQHPGQLTDDLDSLGAAVCFCGVIPFLFLGGPRIILIFFR